MAKANRPKNRVRRGHPLAPIPPELLVDDIPDDDEDIPKKSSPRRKKATVEAAPATHWSLREYLSATRRASFNVVYVVLLLVIYEIGLLVVAEDRRNAADVLLKTALSALGPHGPIVFHGVLLFFLIFVGGRGLMRGEACFRWLVPFVIECAFYAALLSPIVFYLRVPFLARPVHGDYLLDLGAGVYEEILFRFVLIQGLFALIRIDPWHRSFERVDGTTRSRSIPHVGSVAIIVLGAAALFSAYHHVGVGAEPLSLPIFAYRFLAGLVLSLIFLSRGLAVAVYTHAFYDLLLHMLPSS